MRKQQPKQYATTNSPAGRNGNYSVTLDFSNGPRGTVEVKRQPERTTFTQTSHKRAVKK
jgi:hypothetical protein